MEQFLSIYISFRAISWQKEKEKEKEYTTWQTNKWKLTYYLLMKFMKNRSSRMDIKVISNLNKPTSRA